MGERWANTEEETHCFTCGGFKNRERATAYIGPCMCGDESLRLVPRRNGDIERPGLINAKERANLLDHPHHHGTNVYNPQHKANGVVFDEIGRPQRKLGDTLVPIILSAAAVIVLAGGLYIGLDW